MPDMGRGIIAPANSDNIGTGASEMRALASTASAALDALEVSIGVALDGKARKEPVDLADQDLNDVIDEGPYIQTSSSTATAGRNYPRNTNGLYTAGFLEVISRPGDYLVLQRFTAFNGLDMFWRTRYAGTWSPWRRTFRGDEAEPLVSQISTLGYDTGWRDVSALLGEQYVSGEFWIRRTGKVVRVHFYQLRLAWTSGTSVRPAWNLVTGFRPSTRYVNLPFSGRSAAYAAGPMRVSRYGVQDIYGFFDGALIDADATFHTDDAPLAMNALPGAAVSI